MPCVSHLFTTRPWNIKEERDRDRDRAEKSSVITKKSADKDSVAGLEKKGAIV